MKYLATIANLVLLGIVIWFFATKGPPTKEDWLFVIPMILAPVLSIIVILSPKGENWLSLYLKRKALEEKLKIDQLSKKE